MAGYQLTWSLRIIWFMKKRITYIYNQFISMKGKPDAIAMGMAIGVFIGATPTIPFHTALLVFFAALFKQNITAAYLGSWIISNPLTIPFLYFSQYQIGRYLLGIASCDVCFAEMTIRQIISMGWHIAVPLIVGGLISAPFFAIPAYFITLHAVVKIRKRTVYDHSEKDTA
jgi:uncharacterized protein